MTQLASQFSVSGATRSLTDWVAGVLRQAVLDGYFKPGERLDLEGIAVQLDVSRTPLREAIAGLESEGLLESQPHRGVYVTQISKEDIRDVFAVRALLEAEVARQAAQSIPDSVLGALEASLKNAQEAYQNGDSGAQFEADRHFHETLRQYTGNSLLREVLEAVNNRINNVRRFAQTKPGPHVEKFAQEHFAVLRALQRRDAEAAAALMRKHLEASGVRVGELAEARRASTRGHGP